MRQEAIFTIQPIKVIIKHTGSGGKSKSAISRCGIVSCYYCLRAGRSCPHDSALLDQARISAI